MGDGRYIIGVFFRVVMPHAIRPRSACVYSTNVLAEDVGGLPCMRATRHWSVTRVRVTVLSNVLSEQRERSKELGNAVMTKNPFTCTQASCQYTNVVIESTVVAECVKGQDPTIVRV
jgi:hypothetical protein